MRKLHISLHSMAQALRLVQPAGAIPATQGLGDKTMETTFNFSPFVLVTADESGVYVAQYDTGNSRLHACIRTEVQRRIAAGKTAGEAVKEIIAEMNYIGQETA